MTRALVKPIIKLTRSQLKALVRRIALREGGLYGKGGGIRPEVAERLLKYEPPVTREYGMIYGEKPMVPTGVPYPIEQARSIYIQNPLRVVPGRTSEEALSLRTVPQGTPEDIARGIAYERMQIRPVGTAPVERLANETRMKLEQQAEEAARQQMLGQTATPPVSPPTLPGRAALPGTVSTAAAETSAETSVETLVSLAAQAEELWKSLPPRSAARQMWEQLRASSNLSARIKTGKDYFISSWIRYHESPEKFRRNFKREAKILDMLTSQLGE